MLLEVSFVTPKPCAIDSLRLLIGHAQPLRPDFRALRREVQQQFKSVEDYRPYGLAVVILPRQFGHRRDAPLVIDLVGVGNLSGDEIVATMEKIVEGNPLELRIGHIDFTADWFGGSVDLCRQSISIPHKRKSAI